MDKIYHQNNLTEVWNHAAHSLSIEIQAPYYLKASNGKEIMCIAYLPHFGGPHGMVLGAICGPDYETDSHLKKAAELQGLYCSFISEEVYHQYDEDTFKEALLDWGYFGNDNVRPAWIKFVE